MRSISWIEFLITFLIFIIVFYVLFDNLRTLIINIKIQTTYVDLFQKYIFSSFYYIHNKDINNIKFLLMKLNNFLINQEYLEFVKLKYNEKRCFNCIYSYYNLSDKSINIIQNVSLAYNSRLDIKIIVYENFYNITNNSEIKCNPYIDLNDEIILSCSINLYGNSSVKIFPAKDYLFFNLIDSFLDFYDGEDYYKGHRQYNYPYYVKKVFEFYTSKETSIIRNIFMIN